MTIEDLIRVINDETGKEATADSKLDSLIDDSLEFVSLIVRVSSEFRDIPDEVVARLNTVSDLYRAANGELV